MTAEEQTWERYRQEYARRDPSPDAAEAVLRRARSAALRIGLPLADADDAAQDTHLSLMRADLTGVLAFAAYVWTAGRRAAYQILRREQRRRDRQLADDASDVDVEGGASASGRIELEVRELIVRALDEWLAVPAPGKRAVLLLELIEGAAEVPSSLRESGTAASRGYRRDLRRLYEGLTGRLAADEPVGDAPQFDTRRLPGFVQRIRAAMAALNRRELSDLVKRCRSLVGGDGETPQGGEAHAG